MVRKSIKSEKSAKAKEQTEQVVAAEKSPTGGMVQAISEGAAEAYSAAADVIPAAGRAMSRAIYSGFYYVTYGVVFSSLVVGSLIPSDNAMGRGVADGAAAARKDFTQHQAEAESAPTEARPDTA